MNEIQLSSSENYMLKSAVILHKKVNENSLMRFI